MEASVAGRVELCANTSLFLSSLLLLADMAPRDFLPSHRRRVKAVAALREHHNTPVGIGTLEAFRGVYITLTPQGQQTSLELIPVAQLDDLELWLRQWRQGSLTKAALLLLASGFFLQLWPALVAAWWCPAPTRH